MITVREMNSMFKKMIGLQEIKPITYRKMRFYETAPGDPALLFNLLTRELISLNAEEFTALPETIVDGAKSNRLLQTLIQNWYYVPEDFDEEKMRNQFLQTLQLFQPPKILNDYIIFTTTDCNARCFYCYENGIHKFPMSEETAHQVAAFIHKKCGKENASIRWFGGEPLYNEKVIDIICEDLEKSGTPFSSTMVSNGYLFESETVKKAKEKWKLQLVQITLDGTEEVYNRSKNYIYQDGKSAFWKVMGNIDALLNDGIAVLIRMNMDRHNEEDLSRLIDLLCERFGNREDGLCRAYVALLFDFEGKRPFEEKMELAKKCIALEDKLAVYNLSGKGPQKNYAFHHCISDSGKGCIINPKGDLGICEHHAQDELWGHVSHDEVDPAVLERWKERTDRVEDCENCSLLPECLKLKLCPENNTACDEADRFLKRERLRRSMKYLYQRKSEKGTLQEDENMMNDF